MRSARGAGRSLYWYGARTAPYQTHGANMGPFILGPALVASCGSPHNRMPRVPLALPVASYLSRLAPHCFSRLGPAPRMAAPRGRAPSATRMWSASRPDGPAAGRHAFAHCHGLRVTTCSLPPSSLESAFVSVAAVSATVASESAGCTLPTRRVNDKHLANIDDEEALLTNELERLDFLGFAVEAGV